MHRICVSVTISSSLSETSEQLDERAASPHSGLVFAYNTGERPNLLHSYVMAASRMHVTAQMMQHSRLQTYYHVTAAAPTFLSLTFCVLQRIRSPHSSYKCDRNASRPDLAARALLYRLTWGQSSLLLKCWALKSIVLREFKVSDYMASALGRLEKHRGNGTLHGLYTILITASRALTQCKFWCKASSRKSNTRIVLNATVRENLLFWSKNLCTYVNL